MRIKREQIEGITKNLAAAGEHDKIAALIRMLIDDFTHSAQANHRKVLPFSFATLLYKIILC